jgi:FKBP-type peptidyl-prolyl cis-trans isomerase 2
MSGRLVPGMRVRHPGEPDWGVGQIQSIIGQRITVNFENAGKRLINGAVVELVEAEDDPSDARG